MLMMIRQGIPREIFCRKLPSKYQLILRLNIVNSCIKMYDIIIKGGMIMIEKNESIKENFITKKEDSMEGESDRNNGGIEAGESKQKIEALREKLHVLIAKYGIGSKEVLDCSEELDEHIYYLKKSQIENNTCNK